MNGVQTVIGEARASTAASPSDPDEVRRNEIYRALFNGIGDTVLLVQDGRFLDCNDRALEMFRCTREQLIGKSPADISPELQPDGRRSADAARTRIGAALEGERVVFEWRHRRFDGELFDAEVTLNKVDIPGETFFFGIVRDISDRKATQAKLTAAYKRFAWAFDTGPDAMLVASMGSAVGEGVILDINRVAETMFGYPRDEVLGKKVKDLGLLGDLTLLNAARDIVQEKGTVRGFRANLFARDGTRIEAELSSSRFDLEGKVYSLIVVRDVSQQIEADAKIVELTQSLKAERDTLARAFQANPDAVFIATADPDPNAVKILDCNEAAERMFGLSRAGFAGKRLSELQTIIPQQQVESIRARYADVDSFQSLPATMARADGSTFSAEISAAVYVLAGERRSIFVIRDVTERREAERRIRELDTSLKLERDTLASAFRAIPDAAFITKVGEANGLGRILDCNEAAERALGYRREELIGKTVRETGLIANLEALAATRERIMTEGHVQDVKVVMVRRDGTQFEGLDSIASYRFGGESYFVSIIRDVTQRTESERRIRDLSTSLKLERDTLATAFQANPDAILITTAGGQKAGDIRIIDGNDAAERMFGVSRADFVGRTLGEIDAMVSPDVVDAVRAQYPEWDMLRSVPITMRRMDGSKFDAEISGAGYDFEGEPRAIYVVRDVTLQREAQRRIGELTDSLKTERDKFASMFRTNPDAVFVFQVGAEPGTGEFQECNAAAERILGRTRDQIIGHSIRSMSIIPNPAAIGDIRNQLARTGRIEGYRIELQRGDGVRIETELNAARFDLHGLARYILVVRDVTQRIESERRIVELNASLNASLKKTRDITDSLPVFVSYHDMQRRFLFVNKTAQQWMAKSEAELLGGVAADYVPDELIATKLAVVGRDPASAERIEQTLRFPDGKVRTIDASFMPDFGPDGVQHGYYTLIADISEQRSVEEKLRQSQKMDAIGKLTGGIAHDFGNLLAVVQGSLELAAERLEGKDLELMRLLKPALVAARRGGTLTRSLLAFARQQTLTPTVIDVAELARDTAELLSRTLPANIDVACAERAGAAKAEVDAGQLQNALLNLAVNSRDAMPDGGRLTIETGFAHVDEAFNERHPDVAAGDYVTIAVSDTGSGMPADVIARAFDPFFTTKGIGRGTGLGLSMVYGFAKQSHGHVTIYSEVGHGTTVRIYLPRFIGVGRARTARDTGHTGVAHHEHVLVVEDDEDVRFIAVRMLQSLGYVVAQTASAEAALERIKGGETVDLLVTDLVLTDKLNGIQLAEAARAERPGLKILCMSGYTEEAILRDRKLEPYMHFIQKPFGKSDLAAQVRAALDGDG